MDVQIENVFQDGCSCSFCNKGKLRRDGMGLIYPYENVVRFRRSNGSGISPAICEDCLEELYKKGKDEFSKRVI